MDPGLLSAPVLSETGMQWATRESIREAHAFEVTTVSTGIQSRRLQYSGHPGPVVGVLKGLLNPYVYLAATRCHEGLFTSLAIKGILSAINHEERCK